MILRIKEWLNIGKPQFEVTEKSQSCGIVGIRRLNDGQKFYTGSYPAGKNAAFQIDSFDENLIHVYMRLYSNSDMRGSSGIDYETKARGYEVNNLLLTKEGYLKVNLQIFL